MRAAGTLAAQIPATPTRRKSADPTPRERANRGDRVPARRQKSAGGRCARAETPRSAGDRSARAGQLPARGLEGPPAVGGRALARAGRRAFRHRAGSCRASGRARRRAAACSARAVARRQAAAAAASAASAAAARPQYQKTWARGLRVTKGGPGSKNGGACRRRASGVTANGAPATPRLTGGSASSPTGAAAQRGSRAGGLLLGLGCRRRAWPRGSRSRGLSIGRRRSIVPAGGAEAAPGSN